jgi:hypothetical protein
METDFNGRRGAGEGRWLNIKGESVFIGAGGVIEKGPAHLIGKAAIHAVASVETTGAEAEGIHRGLDQIGKAHDIGSSFTSPVRIRVGAYFLNAHDHGAYRIARGDESAGVWIRPGEKETELTAVHEMGHALDHRVFGTAGKYGSETGAMPSLMAFIRSGAASSTLSREVRLAKGRRDSRASHYRYLHKSEERFARAYTQYIARKSGDPLLKAQIERERAGLFGHLMYHTGTEFLKVAAAFDDHFASNKLSIRY